MVQSMTDLKDFSPASQDRGAWWLAARVYQMSTGRDLESDLQEGGHENQIAVALRSTWPSINPNNLRAVHEPGAFMRTPDYYHHHQSADRSVSINHNVTNNVSGGDGDRTAAVLKELQDKHSSDLVRMVNSSVN